MFEQSTLPNGPAAKRVWTTCLGLTGQALLVTGMILAPMIWPEVLPKAQAFMPLTFRPGAPPPLPPGPAVRPRDTRVVRTAFRSPVLIAPAAVPQGVPVIDEPAEFPAGGVIGGIPGGQSDGIRGGIPGSILASVHAVAPPPPPVERPASTVKPGPPAVIRVKTSQLDLARILHRVEPIYPRTAIMMRVSGTVELRGVIGTDGRIRELKVLSGHPLLVKAAADAVSQWIYEPTKLNGQTVEVDAPILVTFRLN